MTFPRRFLVRSAIALVSLAGIAAGAVPATAGPNSNAKILIHLSRVDKVMPCSYAPLRPPCDEIVTTGTWAGGAYFHCPLLATDGDAAAGFAGLSCGIDYPLGDLFIAFTSCAAGQTSYSGPNGPWPAAGSGIVLDWDPADTGCQQGEPGGPGTGVIAIAGTFYIATYIDDADPPVTIAVTPHPQTGLATVESCAGDVDIVENAASANVPYRLGHVGISTDGSVAGYNPCGQVVPVTSSTWSVVKALRR